MQEDAGQENRLYTARVETDGGMLNVRDAPGGRVIGSLAPGEEVGVLCDEGEWAEIAYGSGTGYAAKRYLCFAQSSQTVRIIIEDEEGNAFAPVGGFTLRLSAGPVD